MEILKPTMADVVVLDNLGHGGLFLPVDLSKLDLGVEDRKEKFPYGICGYQNLSYPGRMEYVVE